MRQTLLAFGIAFGLISTGVAPAVACGWGNCYAPAYSFAYPSCGGCGYYGWGFSRLAAPTTQYYYVNQGPTYTGPGAFAPYPAYEEDALPVHRPYPYGYYYGAGVPSPAVYPRRYHFGRTYGGRPVLRRYN